jgi:hypothetical protein
MSLAGLLDVVDADPAIAQAVELARSNARAELDLTAPRIPAAGDRLAGQPGRS